MKSNVRFVPRRAALALATALLTSLASCGGPSNPADAGSDAASDISADRADTGVSSDVVDAAAPADAFDAAPSVDALGAPDALGSDASDASDASDVSDAATACVAGGRTYGPGQRYAAGDGCNWCDCLADHTSACTHRTCAPPAAGCTYGGSAHAFGARFPSTDGCNECVCAASGLACTRRACADGGAAEGEGAVLLGGLGESCGVPTLTGNGLLAYIASTGVHAPFLYERAGPLYPESRADTIINVRVGYAGGLVICRIPAPGQEAIDMEVEVEVTTDDGAFSEGFHTYIRHTRSMFRDAVDMVATVRSQAELTGTYRPSCLDPRGISFDAEFHLDGSASGSVHKTCETDIGLTVGAWSAPPR